MYCPFCQNNDTKVIDSRLNDGGLQVKRRRHCQACESRFTTFEVAEISMPMVIKNDGRKKTFDEQKFRQGIQKALEKRPVTVDDFEQCLTNIKLKLRKDNEKEVSSKDIGEAIMQELKKLDHVAYVRFASVYKSFQDINEFKQTIKALSEE